MTDNLTPIYQLNFVGGIRTFFDKGIRCSVINFKVINFEQLDFIIVLIRLVQNLSCRGLDHLSKVINGRHPDLYYKQHTKVLLLYPFTSNIMLFHILKTGFEFLMYETALEHVTLHSRVVILSL
jgi:hypothetical protein